MDFKFKDIKDCSDLITKPDNIEGKCLTTFLMYNSGPGPNKLATVKLLKEMAGLGLKSAKDCVDLTSDRTLLLKLYLTPTQISRYKKEFMGIGCEFKITGLDQLRNRKLIDLGLYDRDDLLYSILEGLYTDPKNFKFNIEEILNLLTEDQLIKTYNKMYESNL